MTYFVSERALSSVVVGASCVSCVETVVASGALTAVESSGRGVVVLATAAATSAVRGFTASEQYATAGNDDWRHEYATKPETPNICRTMTTNEQ